jgi:hypothetical protein
VKVEMPRDFALPVAMPVDRFADLLVPLPRIVQNAPREDRIERGPVGESLAFGDLRDMVTFMEMVRVAVNKFVITQKNLTFDIRPDGFFVDSPGDELAVFFERFGPRPAELAENPVRGQAGVGFLHACGGQITGPFPLVRYFHHAGAYRIQDDVPANFKKMRIFLDDNGFVSALEEVSGSMPPVIEELGVDTIHLAHAEGKVSVRGLDEEMVVIVHETVGMT